MVGCPPCQSFSKLSETRGISATKDPRSKYVKKFANLAEEMKPAIVIFENVPWIIDPQWTVLQANESFENFRKAFEAWYEKKTGQKIITKVDKKNLSKRPDFVMMHVERKIEIVEIKKPGHKFDNTEFDRLHVYVEKMKEFIEKNKTLAESFPTFHITLICDDVKLSGSQLTAYSSFEEKGILIQKTWEDLLSDTKQSHQDFIRAKNKILKETSADRLSLSVFKNSR